MATPPPSTDFDSAKLYLWVKGLESKTNSLIRELDVLKNDLVKKNIDLRKEVKILSEDILALRHEQEKSLQKMDLVIQELKQTAGKEEVMVLKKYMELWSPLNFVSQRDLDRALQSKIEVMRSSGNIVIKDNEELKQNSLNSMNNGLSETNKNTNRQKERGIFKVSDTTSDNDNFMKNNSTNAGRGISETNKNTNRQNERGIFKVSDTTSETNKKEKHLPFA